MSGRLRRPTAAAAAARPTGNYRSAAAREAHQGGLGQQAAYDGRRVVAPPLSDAAMTKILTALRAGPGRAPLPVVPARQRKLSAELETQAHLDQLHALSL
jgi:hypothetical protein